MTDKIANWYFEDLEVVTSTNDVVVDFLKKVKAPCIVTAKVQTNGRGRLGRKWQAQDGNLYVSFAYPISRNRIGHFAILSAVAILKTLEIYTPKTVLQIKWPNDVLAEGKKISGILFEKAFDEYWVMGIGINIKKAPVLTNVPYEATSLKDLQVETNREAILQELVRNFDALKALYDAQGFDPIKKSWLDKAYRYGQKIIVKGYDKEQCGILKTLDDDGRLVIETDHGLETITAGDIFGLV